jgi:hypothetical protein
MAPQRLGGSLAARRRKGTSERAPIASTPVPSRPPGVQSLALPAG